MLHCFCDSYKGGKLMHLHNSKQERAPAANIRDSASTLNEGVVQDGDRYV